MRVFLGLDLPDDLGPALRAHQCGLVDARWVARENLHVTLRFIGETNPADLEDLGLALDSLRAPAFSLTLRGLGSFDKGGKVNAVWAGVDGDPALTHLQQKLESLVVREGFPPEPRKFVPHVTLARLKRTPDYVVAQWLGQQPPLGPLSFDVDRVVLYRSHLSDGGAHYERLAAFDLDRMDDSIGADWMDGA